MEAAVVEGRGGEIETTGPVSRPRFPMLRGIVGNNELPGGVDRVGIEVERERVEPVPGREGRIKGPRAEMVQGEFGLGEEVGPAIGREGDMAGRHDGDKMILGGADCPLRRKSAMVVGRDVLERKRDRGKVGGEV